MEEPSPSAKSVKIDMEEQPTKKRNKNNNTKKFDVAIIILVTILGGINAGYHLFISDVITPLLRNDNILNAPFQESFFKYGSISVGCIIGSIVAGYLCDLHGRKQTLIYGEWIMFLSLAFLQIGNVASIMIFRIIQGIGIGMCNLAIPLYISEVIRKNIRGAILVTFSTTTSFGMLLAFLFQIQLQGGPIGPGTLTWRDLNWVVIAIPVLMYLFTDLIYHLPKSQEWLDLIEKDIKESNAIDDDSDNTNESSSLLGNNNNNNNNDNNFVIDETLRKNIFQYSNDMISLMKKEEKYYIALLCAVSIFALNVLSGGNVSMLEFETLILPTFGSKDTLNWISIGICHFASSLLAMLLIDFVGRRPLLLIGSFGVSFFSMIIGVLISFSPATSANAFTTIVFFFYISLYQVGPGAMLYVLPCELLPSKIRSYGLSIGFAILFFLQSVIIGIYQISDNRTIRTGGVGGVGIWFYIYSVITVVLTGALLYLIPKDTKRLSLNEIETMYSKIRKGA